MMTAVTDPNDNVKRFLPLTRLQTLSDVIYAASMVATVALIDIPAGRSLETAEEVTRFIQSQLPRLAVFVISGILLTIYWLKQVQQFIYIRRTNTVHTWLEVGGLLSVAVVPFSTMFSEAYKGVFAVQVFYSLNIFTVGFFSFVSWRYATRNRLLVDSDLPQEVMDRVGGEAWVEPVVALLSIGVARLDPRFWELTFLLAPLVFLAGKRLTRRLRGSS